MNINDILYRSFVDISYDLVESKHIISRFPTIILHSLINLFKKHQYKSFIYSFRPGVVSSKAHGSTYSEVAHRPGRNEFVNTITQ